MSATESPPTKEELIARLENLKERAEALNRRIEAQSRPKVGCLALLIGLPFGAFVGTWALTGSLGWAALALLGVVVLGVAAIALFVPTPAHARPGTRAFEARMNATLLERVIDERAKAALATRAPDERARLAREIVFLREQLAAERAVSPDDASPGRGSVGFTPYSGE